MSKQVYTVTKEGIEYLCGLIRDVVSLPSEMISNINLADNLTFSNIHIKDLIDQCLKDANTEAQKLVGALTHLTCEKTTTQPTLDGSEINVIYLHSIDGNPPFQQFLKISDTELIDLGSTSISLNDYLTATEIASTYAKQVDLNTLTDEINNIKSDIGTETMTTTSTTIKGAINELKGEMVKKTDIVTTIDSTSTDTQVPSAKALYDDIKKGRIIFTDLPYGTDILAWADSLPDENFSQVYFCRANECVNRPPNVTDGFIMVRRIPNEKWIGLTWYDIRSTQTFECRKLNDVWGEWSTISPIKEGQVVNSNGGGVNYFKQIKNMVIVTCSNTTRLIYTWNVGASINEGALPKPIIKIPVSIMSSNGEFYLAELDTDGYIKVKNRNIPATETGNIYYYSFNYITGEL